MIVLAAIMAYNHGIIDVEQASEFLSTELPKLLLSGNDDGSDEGERFFRVAIGSLTNRSRRDKVIALVLDKVQSRWKSLSSGMSEVYRRARVITELCSILPNHIVCQDERIGLLPIVPMPSANSNRFVYCVGMQRLLQATHMKSEKSIDLLARIIKRCGRSLFAEVTAKTDEITEIILHDIYSDAYVPLFHLLLSMDFWGDHASVFFYRIWEQQVFHGNEIMWSDGIAETLDEWDNESEKRRLAAIIAKSGVFQDFFIPSDTSISVLSYTPLSNLIETNGKIHKADADLNKQIRYVNDAIAVANKNWTIEQKCSLLSVIMDDKIAKRIIENHEIQEYWRLLKKIQQSWGPTNWEQCPDVWRQKVNARLHKRMINIQNPQDASILQ